MERSNVDFKFHGTNLELSLVPAELPKKSVEKRLVELILEYLTILNTKEKKL